VSRVLIIPCSFCADNSLNYNQAMSVIEVSQSFLKNCAIDAFVDVDKSIAIFQQQVFNPSISMMTTHFDVVLGEQHYFGC
jgi:superfamily II helicase